MPQHEYDIVKELANITVGVTSEGMMGIRVRASKTIDLLGLTPNFDRGAAAFAREFMAGEEVIGSAVKAGNAELSPELHKLFAEATTEHIDLTETPATAQEAGGPQSTTDEQETTQI